MRFRAKLGASALREPPRRRVVSSEKLRFIGAPERLNQIDRFEVAAGLAQRAVELDHFRKKRRPRDGCARQHEVVPGEPHRAEHHPQLADPVFRHRQIAFAERAAFVNGQSQKLGNLSNILRVGRVNRRCGTS